MKQRGSRIDCPCYTLTVLSQPGRQANMAYRDCTTRQHVVFSHHSLWLFLKSPKSCEISKTWLIWETESMTSITIHTPFWLWAGVCLLAYQDRSWPVRYGGGFIDQSQTREGWDTARPDDVKEDARWCLWGRNVSWTWCQLERVWMTLRKGPLEFISCLLWTA